MNFISRDRERCEHSLIISILKHNVGDRLFGITDCTGRATYRIVRTGRTFAFDLEDGVITAAYDLGITSDEGAPPSQDVIYTVVVTGQDDCEDEIPFCDFSNILEETEALECQQEW